MRGRSRRKKRTGKMVSLQKRFLAFMLAFAMIFTNVGTDLHVSFAASGNKVDFTIGGADLVDAIRQAIEDENVVSQDSLDFTDGATEKFEALFFGDGKVYEVYPDIQGDSMEAELRVFVKLPADADDTYMVTGEEEVYFLYVNNGEDTISCSTTVTRTENGKEKEILVPAMLDFPKRTEKPGIESNTIEHRPLYIFGLNREKDSLNPQDRTGKAVKSHQAFVDRNLEFIDGINSSIVDAFRHFLQSWKPEAETENRHILDLGKDYAGAGFAFCLVGNPDLLLRGRRWPPHGRTARV